MTARTQTSQWPQAKFDALDSFAAARGRALGEFIDRGVSNPSGTSLAFRDLVAAEDHAMLLNDFPAIVQIQRGQRPP